MTTATQELVYDFEFLLAAIHAARLGIAARARRDPALRARLVAAVEARSVLEESMGNANGAACMAAPSSNDLGALVEGVGEEAPQACVIGRPVRKRAERPTVQP